MSCSSIHGITLLWASRKPQGWHCSALPCPSPQGEVTVRKQTLNEAEAGEGTTCNPNRALMALLIMDWNKKDNVLYKTQTLWCMKQFWKSPSMTASCVDCPLLTAHHKVIDISCWESHSCDCHRFGFIVHQFHTLLPKQTIVIFWLFPSCF